MYRRTYARIHLDNLKQNIENAAKNLPPSCGIVAVVKANAYGHGAVECSFAAKSAGARMLAVALAEEAQELRGAGIDMPVMIIGRQILTSCGSLWRSICSHAFLRRTTYCFCSKFVSRKEKGVLCT